MATTAFAVIAGVGPGTGAALVRKFAQVYPVVLLARREESFRALVQEVRGKGGFAIGVATDVSVESSVMTAFEEIRSTFGENVACAVCIELDIPDITRSS